ncbi:MAG: adenosylhopane nucleosidase, partial [Gammaproteobacteria bacterium]
GFPFVGGGALASVAEPLANAAEKTALAARTGALMVDMEAAAVAAVAAAHEGMEFAVVRALADPADLALASVVLAAADKPRPGSSVVRGLLKRPQDLPAVLRLGRSFRRARASLEGAAQALAAARGL